MLGKPLLQHNGSRDFLKVRGETVRGWIYQQELHAVKLGGEFPVAVKGLRSLVNQNTAREPG